MIAGGLVVNADGFIDCWPNCSLVQRAVGTTFFAAPVAALLAIGVLVAEAVSARLRSTR